MIVLQRQYMFRISVIVWMIVFIQYMMADNIPNGSPTLISAKKYDKSTVMAISPDGETILIEDWGIKGYPLRLVEIDTWKTMYTHTFRSRIFMAEYFSDSHAIFLYDDDLNRYILNLDNNEQIMVKKKDNRSPYVRETSYPVNNRTILIRNSAGTVGTSDLILAEFPSYNIIKKVPFTTQPRESRTYDEDFGYYPPNEQGFTISDNRGILAYSFDHNIVCRSTNDLNKLWKRKITPPLNAYNVVLSPNGKYIVAEITNDLYKPRRKEYYISILDGETGEEITRLAIPDSSSMAVSSDGKMLAVSDAKQDENTEEWILKTNIYEIPSLKILDSVIHDRIKDSDHSWVETGFTTRFTPDGRYLITSGMNTTIWKIERTSVDVKVTPKGINPEK